MCRLSLGTEEVQPSLGPLIPELTSPLLPPLRCTVASILPSISSLKTAFIFCCNFLLTCESNYLWFLARKECDVCSTHRKTQLLSPEGKKLPYRIGFKLTQSTEALVLCEVVVSPVNLNMHFQNKVYTQTHTDRRDIRWD